MEMEKEMNLSIEEIDQLNRSIRKIKNKGKEPEFNTSNSSIISFDGRHPDLEEEDEIQKENGIESSEDCEMKTEGEDRDNHNREEGIKNPTPIEDKMEADESERTMSFKKDSLENLIWRNRVRMK